jgi:hypothetical protein
VASDFLTCDTCGKEAPTFNGCWMDGWYCVLQCFSACSLECARKCLKEHHTNPDYSLDEYDIARYQKDLHGPGMDGFSGEYKQHLKEEQHHDERDTRSDLGQARHEG